MSKKTSLINNFLIAMPNLQDDRFQKTVTYICEHNNKGAMGLVINRPLEISLKDVFKEMNIKHQNCAIEKQIIYSGGPVEKERGFVMHNDNSIWDSTLKITADISISTSRDILEAIAENKGPKTSLVALGYAGWGAGQLESEMKSNSWLNGPTDPAILFDVPSQQRWKASAELMGINLSLLSADVGHA